MERVSERKENIYFYRTESFPNGQVVARLLAPAGQRSELSCKDGRWGISTQEMSRPLIFPESFDVRIRFQQHGKNGLLQVRFEPGISVFPVPE